MNGLEFGSPTGSMTCLLYHTGINCEDLKAKLMSLGMKMTKDRLEMSRSNSKNKRHDPHAEGEYQDSLNNNSLTVTLRFRHVHLEAHAITLHFISHLKLF